jgi:N-acetyl-anhydromuramyl-L-alanine amidase AmpD
VIQSTKRDQWRTTRLHADKTEGVPRAIVLHTAEGTKRWTVARLAELIETRDTAGSYHMAADVFGDTDQFIPFEFEAYHVGPRNGVLRPNAMSVGLAWTFAAGDWPNLTPKETELAVDAGARAVHRFDGWMQANLGERFVPRMLTVEQFWQGASGFIRHAVLDPDRRSDPGTLFPEYYFIQRTQALLLTTRHITVPTEGSTDMDDRELQQLLKDAGYELAVDGKRGPKTNAQLRLALEDLGLLADLKAYFNR